jgi:SET domain-containing protein
MFSLKNMSLEELQERLQFHFLAHNAFESKEEVLAKGLASQPSEEAVALGKQFIDRIKAAYIPDVSIRWVDENVGYGLFAEEIIETGSYVGEYTGQVRENDIRRYLEPLNNYCYEYPVVDSLGRSFVIDAIQGNLTRFINHSFTPNLRPVHVYYDGFYHLIFLAIQKIELGTQLLFNYGQNYWYLRGKPSVFRI